MTTPASALDVALASAPPAERDRLARDFNAYRRELPRLLAEGHANRWILIRQGTVLSVWDTYRDALQAGYERFGLDPFAVNRVNPLDVERFTALEAQAPPPESPCPS